MSGLVSTAAEALAWLKQAAPQARELQLDSRRVQGGDVFIAVPGGRSDGRQFIDAACKQGAAAVLIDAQDWQARALPVPALLVQNLRAQLGALAAAFYSHPSRQLRSIGVTGTNGKTSTTQWIAQLLTQTGTRCGVIGTVGLGFPGEALSNAELTTPDPIGLQRAVRRMVDAGAQALAMEVSSIGLEQGRVDGMQFDIALFTNLTRDHLDYHGTMERYEAAKAKLFAWPSLTHAVINLDDAAGQRLVQSLAGRVAVIGYTQQDTAPSAPVKLVLRARDVVPTADGMQLRIGDGAEEHLVNVPLVGMFNVSNLLGVLGVVLACGMSLQNACALLPRLLPPPGRMQKVASGSTAQEPLAVVDYAHTPDALEKALAALRPIVAARGGRLWVVFGAGGDRDPGKRAPMGAAATQAADYVVITSDNPRSEDPQQILAQVAAGVARTDAQILKIVDRAEAIRTALTRAAASDVVLIAGKGHEDYQEIAGRKHPFSDVEQALNALKAREAQPC